MRPQQDFAFQERNSVGIKFEDSCGLVTHTLGLVVTVYVKGESDYLQIKIQKFNLVKHYYIFLDVTFDSYNFYVTEGTGNPSMFHTQVVCQ